MGIVASLGHDLPSFWEDLLQGKSGAGRITRFDAGAFDSQIACEVKNFDPGKYLDRKSVRHLDVFSQYAIVAASMAVEDAGLDFGKEDSNRIGVIVGCGIGGTETWEEQHAILLQKGPGRINPFFIPKMIMNMAAGQIAIRFGLRGPNLCPVTACASGNHAIGESFRIIQRGDADVVLAGGCEAAITPLSVAGFCAVKALSHRNHEPQKASRPFDKDRDGFVMGEGSGIVVMEALEHANARGARIYAEMAGFGMTADAYHVTAPSPDGEGGGRAMRLALEDAALKPADVNYINAHGTSTSLGDIAETRAIKKEFGDYARKVVISSTKSMVGHLLGAAGGVEFIVITLAAYHDAIPPTINLDNPDPECDLDYAPNQARRGPVNVAMSNAFGFGGHNAVLVVKKFREGS